jgi:chitinase
MYRRRFRLVSLAVVLCTAVGFAGPGKWVSAYYAGWLQGSQLNPEEIDYSRLTHIIHFALVVNANGTFAGDGNGITPANAASAVRAAHAAGKKILISVGGSNTDGAFAGATSGSKRDGFVASLVAFMMNYGYDGIDVDWEPLGTTSHYVDFIRELREKMSSVKPGSPLITAVMTGSDGRLLASVAQYFDQINIMTYDMSGPWSRWETWHNAPLYNGGAVFQSTGGPLPSSDVSVRDKIAAGVPAAKLGIGIDFYGYRWWGGDGTSTGGVTKPRQAWKAYPNVKDNIPYYSLMDMYARYPVSWDDDAKAAYIGIDNPGSAQDEFISFDEPRSIYAKAAYVDKMGLGGVIVFELGGGYRKNLPAGYRDILLQTVGNAFTGGKKPAEDRIPPSVTLVAPKDKSTLAGSVTLLANATDNSAVSSVEFRIDGEPASQAVVKPPYAATINTWKYGKGSHAIEVVAYDVFGNHASAKATVSVSNTGSAPVVPDRVVYDDALRAPFVNTSWGATVDFGSHARIHSGSSAAEVSFMAWGAFDLLSGTWGAESPIDPTEYDTLRADVYPLSPMSLKVAFYNGSSTDVQLKANEWNAVAVPLKFAGSISRFYFQSGVKNPVKCYFDNIRFTPKTYRATTAG